MEFKFTQFFCILSELNLVYKKNQTKIKLLKIINSKLAHAFLVPAQLSPSHGLSGLA
jgi:hypothetical protein